MKYRGMELDPPKGRVALTHSVSLDMIRKESSTENMDWTDALGTLPWSVLKDSHPQVYDDACRLFSLLHMDYQVCNGGIGQYFYNRYHQAREPYHADDVALYNIDAQKEDFLQLAAFARELYPERQTENEFLRASASAFEKLWMEEHAEVIETIYCDEDPVMWDPELEEDVENPDYFEPYDETTYEDVIHGDDGFDEIFYQSNDYMEELLELRAQVICKQLVREVEHAQSTDLLNILRDAFPASAFVNQSREDAKEPFHLKISAAVSRADVPFSDRTPMDHTLQR